MSRIQSLVLLRVSSRPWPCSKLIVMYSPSIPSCIKKLCSFIQAISRSTLKPIRLLLCHMRNGFQQQAFLASLLELSAYSIPVFFMDAYPVQSSDRSENADQLLQKLKQARTIDVCSSATIVARLKALGAYDVECQGSEEALRYYHYIHSDEQVYFFTNESKYKTLHTRIKVRNSGTPLI